MRQDQIIEKFVKFLEIIDSKPKNQSNHTKVRTRAPVIDFISQGYADISSHHFFKGDLKKLAALIKAEGGCCFGFSIVYGAMGLLGKGAWWYKARFHISAWDETVESLEKLILLPDSDNQVSLKSIFMEAIFNVARAQGFYIDENGNYQICSDGDDQLDILLGLKINENDPNLLTFYVGGLIYNLQNLRALIQENINKEKLLNRLIQNKDAIAKSVCLVSSSNHTCEISYRDDLWCFYDPNYGNGQAAEFTNVQDVVTEIFNILFRVERIVLADLVRKQDFSPLYFYQLMNDFNYQVIEILNNFDSEKTRDSFSRFLTTEIKEAEGNGFHNFVKCCATHIPKLFVLVARHPMLQYSFVKALLLKSGPNQLTGLQVLIKAKPDLAEKKVFTQILINLINGYLDNEILGNLRWHLMQAQFDFLRSYTVFSNYYTLSLLGKRVQTSKSWSDIERALSLQMLTNATKDATDDNRAFKVGELCKNFPFVGNFRKYPINLNFSKKNFAPMLFAQTDKIFSPKIVKKEYQAFSLIISA